MNSIIRWILCAAAAGGAVLACTGCNQVSQTHESDLADANKSFLHMRSTLMLQTGQRQFDARDLDQAEKTVTDALAQDPTHPGLYVLAGRVRLERGELESAKLLLTKAIELDPKLAEAHYFLGIVAQRWQQYAVAQQCYHQAYVLAPAHAPYLLAEAEMLVDLDHLDEALALLLDKLSYFDQNAAIRGVLAHIYLLQHHPDKAAEFFQQAALLRPDDMSVVEDLARAQLAAGQGGAALVSLQQLCKDPVYAERMEVLRLLGDAYVSAERLAEARDVFVRAMRLAPRDAENWQKLSEVCWALHDAEAALSAARTATNLAPKRYEGWLLAGLAYRATGRTTEALSAFERAADLAPATGAPLILLGLTLEQAGRPAEAARAYAQALQREPTDPRAQQLLARVNPKVPQ